MGTATSAQATGGNVGVCKYSGTPGADTYQTYTEPGVATLISKGWTEEDEFPFEWNDAQGGSIAIGWAEDVDASDCPGYADGTVSLPQLNYSVIEQCGEWGSVTMPTTAGVSYAISDGDWTGLEGVHTVTATLMDKDMSFGTLAEGWRVQPNGKSATWTTPNLGTFVACDDGGGDGDVVDLARIVSTPVGDCGTYGSVTKPEDVDGVEFSIEGGDWTELEGVQTVTALLDEGFEFGSTDGWDVNQDGRSATWTTPDLGTFFACTGNPPSGGNPPVKPTKPAAVVSTNAEVTLDCDADEVVTTTTTTTTDWVFDENAWAWVKGTPAAVVVTETTPADDEECPDEVLPVEGEEPAPVEPDEGDDKPVSQPDDGEVEGVDADRPKPRPQPVVAGQPEALPTAVDAGLAPVAAVSTSSPLGQGLLAGGLLMLVLAGALQTGRRERGAHEV